MPQALVVDDDSRARELLAKLVEKEGFSTSTAGDLAAARELIAETWPDIVLLDLKLPDGSGLELLDDLEEPAPEVVLVTGHATIDTAIEGLRQGVTDYLLKPVDTSRLRGVLARVARAQELRSEVQDLRSQLRDLGRFGQMVGASPPMQEVYDRIRRVAPTDATVLVTGESGTGKELVARTVHRLSDRKKGSFCALNCGGVSSELIESELFGHEKGAFTGAHRKHEGYFERASGGTLFLDEVTEMPPELQVKLLRTLETGELTRVGGEETLEVDVRLIAATNRSVEDAVAEGLLREDLYFRLKVFRIDLPPLRQRGDDIELLARFWLDQLNREQETQKRMAPETLDALLGYSWPGNVRELKNAIRSAHILADDVIEIDVLPEEITRREGFEGVSGPSVRLPLGSSIADAERRLIGATLELHDGNKTQAAETLGISVRTLYNRLKEYEEATDQAATSVS